MTPVGITAFYAMDQTGKTIVPFLAVAGGTYIFIYKNLRGAIMFPIPDQKLNTEENDIYTKFAEGKIDAKECVKAIKELNQKIVDYDPNDANNDDRWMYKHFWTSKQRKEFHSILVKICQNIYQYGYNQSEGWADWWLFMYGLSNKKE